MEMLFDLLLLSLLAIGVVSSLSLSPIEAVLLKSRLENIQGETRREISSVCIPSEPCIIFHGAGGPDQFTEELREVVPNAIVWDWTRHRGSVASAAYDGEAVGEAVGSALREKEVESVHSIGISVGAFCANAMASTLRDGGIKVRLTLLDPFCNRGLLGFGYGLREFGTKSDFALQIMNTDDPVPSTNDPIPNCFCMDVTKAPQRASFELPEGETMHCWPVAFYARYGFQMEDASLFPEHGENNARGTVVVVK